MEAFFATSICLAAMQKGNYKEKKWKKWQNGNTKGSHNLVKMREEKRHK